MTLREALRNAPQGLTLPQLAEQLGDTAPASPTTSLAILQAWVGGAVVALPGVPQRFAARDLDLDQDLKQSVEVPGYVSPHQGGGARLRVWAGRLAPKLRQACAVVGLLVVAGPIGPDYGEDPPMAPMGCRWKGGIYESDSPNRTTGLSGGAERRLSRPLWGWVLGEGR